MSTETDALKNHKPKHEFLICIDSDGCAFDTMEVKHKEISTGTSRQRSNRTRRRTSWIKTGIKSLRGAMFQAISRR